ncbi:unnamed protein product, partial [Ectocarpus sp. 6 AP-2014]
MGGVHEMERKEASRRRMKSTVFLSRVHEEMSGGRFSKVTNMHHRRRTSQRLWARASYVR